MRKRVKCPGDCNDVSGNNLLTFIDDETRGF